MTKLASEAEVIRALAEKVMGWRVNAWLTGPPSNDWQARDDNNKVRVSSDYDRPPSSAWNNWHPLRSLADAFELADRFGGGYEIERRAGEDIPYFVSLWDAPNEGWYGGGITLQGAIVKAALASIGCEYEEQAR